MGKVGIESGKDHEFSIIFLLIFEENIPIIEVFSSL